MKALELAQGYKRFLKNSALTNKERNLVEDYSSIENWILKNASEENRELVSMLRMDAQYQTITKTVNRNLKFKDMSPFGSWDGQAVKDSMNLIQNLKNAEDVGDVDTCTLIKGRLGIMFRNLTEMGSTASLLYIVQRWMEEDSAIMRAYRKTHKEVEQIIGLSTDEDIEAMLQSIFHSNDKKPSPAVTETNIETAPEVSDEISKRAYDAYLTGDVDGIRRCINDVTALYAKGYFNRHGMSEENAADIFKGWVSAFKKYIKRLEGEDVESGVMRIDVIKTIIDSSTETDGETS